MKFQHFVKKEFYEEELIYPVIETFNLEFVEKWEIMQKSRINRRKVFRKFFKKTVTNPALSCI